MGVLRSTGFVLMFGYCAFLSDVATSDRMVLRADVVRDHLGMCYDVTNCVPRAVNETWIIGQCAIAKCEMHESGMLLEVRMMCPRFHKHVRAKCDYIEDLKLPFPQCCPHTVCKKEIAVSNLKKANKKVSPENMNLHHIPVSHVVSNATVLN